MKAAVTEAIVGTRDLDLLAALGWLGMEGDAKYLFLPVAFRVQST